MKTSTSASMTKGSPQVADRGRALGIDVDEDIDTLAKIVDHRRLESSVFAAVHFGILEKLAGGHTTVELLVAEKVIVLAPDFTGARRACRA